MHKHLKKYMRLLGGKPRRKSPRPKHNHRQSPWSDDCLTGTLDLLVVDEQRIVRKVLEEGKSVTQAGEELGLDEAEANSLFHTAMSRYKEFLEGRGM